MNVKPVPCAHIADYYQAMWEGHKSIGSNLLRQGYRKWADGGPITVFNNLFRSEHDRQP